MPYILPYKKMALSAFLLSFVLAALTGAQVKLIKPIFDQGLGGSATLSEVLMLTGLRNYKFPDKILSFLLDEICWRKNER